jgi:hypothetical protein
MPGQRLVATVTLLGLVALAGCGGALGGGDEPEATVTPAPVPEATDPTVTDRGRTAGPGGDAGNGSADYASLEPTCTRPPGLVVAVQVGALSNNDPETDDGVRTAWRFAAPSNRDVTGPYASFRRLINTSYRPLLEAETVTYGPVDRNGRTAERTVTVTAATGNSTAYRWRLTRVTGGQYDGCWMTSGVRTLDAPPAS